MRRIGATVMPTNLRTKMVLVFLVVALLSMGLLVIGSKFHATVLGAMIVAALVVAVTVGVAERIAAPITRLTVVAEQIAAGDLTTRARVESDDEIGQLARSFNSMTERLQQTLEGLEQRNQRLYQEVAERKQVEQQLRQYATELQARNDELDAFAHTVAHDLKDPLGVLVGYAEVLQRIDHALPQAEVQHYHRVIARNARKMSQIVDGLLLLAGVRQLQVELVPLNMAAIVAESQRRLAHLIEKHQAQITLPERWPLALGYGPWVEEVWANYLSNALKYGGDLPRIELGATILGGSEVVPATDRKLIRFWVRDNGPGFSPEERARLFEPFTQLDHGQAGGHGLGLSIVRRIVERLGGQVDVESRMGEGSVFSFTLQAVEGMKANQS